MASRTYDVILWGSTGFTGQLTVDYLQKSYPDVKFAIAGRNEVKLLELVKKLNLKSNVGIITADISNIDSLDAMTRQSKVVLSTAGPFAKIGSNLVDSCVRSGTHYCDITGEPQFCRAMIDQHHDTAEKNKVKIVHCCGFDCIPSDIGTYMMVEGMKRKSEVPQEVRFLASAVKGGFSGGTIASVINLFESYPVSTLIELADPYYLAPRDDSNVPIRPTNKAIITAATDNMMLGYDKIFKTWTMPYIMQGIDTRVVNRSNSLGWRYGQNFLYSERMKAPFAVALLTTLIMPIASAFLFFPWTRNIIKRFVPASGEYSSDLSLLDSGFFKVKLWGRSRNSAGLESISIGEVIALNGDPGYRQTAKMIAESAICLARDADVTPHTFGVLTPSVAFGSTIIKRLQAKGMEFNLEGKPFDT